MFRSPISVLIHKIKELNRLNLYVDSKNIIITSYLKSTIYQSDNIAVKDNLQNNLNNKTLHDKIT